MHKNSNENYIPMMAINWNWMRNHEHAEDYRNSKKKNEIL